MAMKEIAQRLQPLPLYFILGLTVCLFFLELVVAHVTHSLTLLLDAYHALCNIIVLVGSIISINHGSGRSERVSNNSTSHISNDELKSLSSLPQHTQMCCVSRPGPERRLRNTFGWARVDVIVMLIGCVFLASLCFSVLVEALQTLVHISHHDEMHRPLFCLGIGVLAMVLNLLAYLLIGGYTFHQASFLNTMTETGVVVEAGDCQTESQKKAIVPPTPSNAKRQGLWGLSRDCIGCVVVIVCSISVYSTESEVAKYVDPAFSILSAVLVLLFSYPFMKESCLILLQTIPDHINIGSLCSQLLAAFPDVVNVHELHVWRLTVDKTYCTAHIIFLNPKEYARITDDISRFFLGQGITHVTIQPEFYKDINKKELVSSTFSDCLVSCTEDMCLERHCCASRSPSLESVHVDHGHGHGHSHTHAHRRKGTSKAKPCSHADTILEVASSCVSQLSEVNTAVSTAPTTTTTAPATTDSSTTVTLVTPEAKTGTTDSDRGEKKDVQDLRIQFLTGGVKQDAVRRETTDV